ncbi:unnamed protein product [Durusdinium trenchii]|uniref:PPIase cyclophilin-type domain-containing protein n=1 Tax=Durusdinium trenchii TaxID=1381693 RepID=A0ABP0PRJ9_9DINO
MAWGKFGVRKEWDTTQLELGRTTKSQELVQPQETECFDENGIQSLGPPSSFLPRRCFAVALCRGAVASRALHLVPEDCHTEMARHLMSIHLNLAQACLQLKVDQENAKAFYRRGLAQEALGRTQGAANDLQRAVRIEPRNAEVRKKYEELKKLLADVQKKKDEEEGPVVHDLQSLPRAWLEVAIGEQEPKRLVFVLYADSVPKTAENFRQLCTGEREGVTARGKKFHYKGSILHRMIPGLMIQGGDFENANGTGGESIYGRRFPDENFRESVARRGLLCMANDGPNTNGSNFFISFEAAEHLERKHVVFGELFSGMDLLAELEKLETNEERRPLVDCVIVDCGAQGAATPA